MQLLCFCCCVHLAHPDKDKIAAQTARKATMASKQPSNTLIQVPARFSIVEPGVYRSATPTAAQVGSAKLVAGARLTPV